MATETWTVPMGCCAIKVMEPSEAATLSTSPSRVAGRGPIVERTTVGQGLRDYRTWLTNGVCGLR